MSDESDWFQVVAEQEGEECALEARAVAQGALGAAISEEGHRWGALFTEHYEIELLRRRPGADVWSAIEYAAHVRDVMALFRDRVVLALSEREPEFGWWHHEAAAVDERYNEQDPGEVAAALRPNAAGLVRVLPSPGTRHGPGGNPLWTLALHCRGTCLLRPLRGPSSSDRRRAGMWLLPVGS